MSKKIMCVTLFCFLVLLGFGSAGAVRAEEAREPRFMPFAPVVTDPLYISTGDAADCPAVVSDTARYRFTLLVTEELLAELNAAVADGYTPVIAFPIRDGLDVSGNGTAEYDAQLELFIDYVDGERTAIVVVEWFEEALVSPYSITMKNVLVTSVIDDVMPGDIITIEATARGSASSGGCQSDDQALVSWGLFGGDNTPDLPVLALCNNEWVDC